MGLEYGEKMIWDRRGFGVRKMGKSMSTRGNCFTEPGVKPRFWSLAMSLLSGNTCETQRQIVPFLLCCWIVSSAVG